MRTALRLCLVFVLGTVLCLAQSSTTAVVSGQVNDKSGAIVPDASLTLRNSATGAVREGTTDQSGTFRFILVEPGTYELSVSKEGFEKQVQGAITATVGAALRVDFSLVVGATKENVQVTDAILSVETERSGLASTIETQVVTSLPANRRDFLSFALLAPGVADSKAQTDGTSFRVKQTADSGLSFFGSNGRGNYVSVDGGEGNDDGGGVRPTVSQEAVREFQINSANYQAEFGAARGGVINIVTKGGTNDYRGTLFGFFRQDGLDATDPFALVLSSTNTVQRIKPDSQRQQFGAVFGGPIKKDKTFFFLSFEQLRRRESNAVPVLTDFSIFQPTAAQQAILGGLPVASAAALTAALSAPASTVDMFKTNSGVFPFTTDDNKGLLRFDHQINSKDRLFLRFNATGLSETNQNVAALVGLSRGFVQEVFDGTALASWTRIVSPTLVNEVHAQFNYQDQLTASNDKFGPAFEIPGYGFFNRDRFLPSDTIARHLQADDALSVVKGSHSMRLGAHLLVRNNRSDTATFFSGRFTFGTLPGAFVSPALASTTITGLQAFNLGLAQSYQQGFYDGVQKATYPLGALFFQDSWKPFHTLTLDFGVRYEIDHRKDPIPTSYSNFMPRFGFAWDPFKDGKTVIRGGYGLFYAAIDFQIDYTVNALGQTADGFRPIAQVLSVLSAANPLAANGPVNIFQTLKKQGVIGIPTPKGPIQVTDLAQFGIFPLQRGPLPPLAVLFAASPDYKNPQTQQASIQVERAFGNGYTAGFGGTYVRGSHLTDSYDSNLLQAPVNALRGIRDWGATATNPTGAAYFRNPLIFQYNIYESEANSFYGGLILTGAKRFGRRGSINFNYTWSHATDESTDYNSDFQPNDQTCRRCDRASSSFDQRHKLVGYAMFNSPTGATDTTWRKLSHNWSATPIYRFNSGRPFNLLAGGEVNNDRHNTTDRPIFAGRNLGLGPTFWTADLRVMRQFAFTETKSLQILIEGFNLFNHVNYSGVNNTMGCSATAPAGNPASCYISDIGARVGTLTGQGRFSPSQPFGFTSAYDMRRIQLGVKFYF